MPEAEDLVNEVKEAINSPDEWLYNESLNMIKE